MLKVVPIRDRGPKVEDVLLDVSRHQETFRSVTVIAVTTQGEIVTWASGRLEDICAQSLMLSEYAKSHLRGEIEYEFEPHPSRPEE